VFCFCLAATFPLHATNHWNSLGERALTVCQRQPMEFDEATIVMAMRCSAGEGVRHDGLSRRTTLVVCKSEAVAASSHATVNRLDREEVKVVTSFSAACRMIVGNVADQVVILEVDELRLDDFEIDVIRRLAENLPVVRVHIPERQLRLPATTVTGRDEGSIVSLYQRPGSDAMEARLGGLTVERYARWFSVDNQPTPISATETELMWALVSTPTGVVSVANLKSVFRNPTAPGSSNLLRQYIHRLRSKLTRAGAGVVIVSIRGGYCIRLPAGTAAATSGDGDAEHYADSATSVA
jgi:hypothetical protein